MYHRNCYNEHNKCSNKCYTMMPNSYSWLLSPKPLKIKLLGQNSYLK